MPSHGGAGHLVPISKAVASFFAFTMPNATPPNATVFPSGCITIPQMFRAGVVLDPRGPLIVPADAFELGATPYG